MDLTGRTLNHYRFVAHLGQGGMGEVWVAEDTKLGRRVAVKTLPARVAADLDRRARFEREARAIAALNHPNIVTIHSVEEAGGVVFLTMELIEGKTLADLIPARGLPLERFFDLAIPLAGALAAAHQKGITHRDLKPANVMVTSDGRVKVLDFGLAKLAESIPAETAEALKTATATATGAATGEGKILGTAAYMSPEQAEGKPVRRALGRLLPRHRDVPDGVGGAAVQGGHADLDDHVDPPRHAGLDRRVEARDAAPPGARHLTLPRERARSPLSSRPRRAHNELEGLRTEIDSGEIVATVVSDSAAKLAPRKASSRRIVPAVAALVATAALVVSGVLLWPKLRGGSSLPTAAEGREKQSIAVLPFVNMSDDAKNDYFSDGLAEELLNVLAKVPGLKVAARTSSFHFKGATGSMADIGRQLGVATILEGSVRRAGNRVRIKAELINAADGFQLWSESYDRELNDIFAIQESIAGDAVAALKVKLLGAGEAAAPPARKATTNLEAYDAYLLGQQKMARRTSASLAEAARSFRKAIDLDPNYALAYVGLSDATQRLSEYSNLPQSEVLAKAEPLLRKALALDDRLGEAYASRAGLEGLKLNGPAAEADFRKAIELSPNYSMAHMWYALMVQGRDPKKALELHRKALELDPLSPVVNINLADCLRRLGRPQDAAERTRRAIEIEPGMGSAYGLLADICGDELNQPDEAVRFQRKAVEVDPGNLGQRTAWPASWRGWGAGTRRSRSAERSSPATPNSRLRTRRWPRSSRGRNGWTRLSAGKGRRSRRIRNRWTLSSTCSSAFSTSGTRARPTRLRTESQRSTPKVRCREQSRISFTCSTASWTKRRRTRAGSSTTRRASFETMCSDSTCAQAVSPTPEIAIGRRTPSFSTSPRRVSRGTTSATRSTSPRRR